MAVVAAAPALAPAAAALVTAAAVALTVPREWQKMAVGALAAGRAFLGPRRDPQQHIACDALGGTFCAPVGNPLTVGPPGRNVRCREPIWDLH